MNVGDVIECWNTREVYKKMMEYARDGIMTDIAKDRRNCLIVTEIREMKGGKDGR